MELTEYQLSLLTGWEEIYKQGQLTFWILLSLKDGPKHMADIQSFIDTYTRGAIKADDRSIYRALRRYDKADIVGFKKVPGQGGPERKVYYLTQDAEVVFDAFCKRNIVNVFYQPAIEKLIKEGI